MRRPVIPAMQPIPAGASSGQKDMALIKFAAELQKQNPDCASWIGRQAMEILKRRTARPVEKQRARR